MSEGKERISRVKIIITTTGPAGDVEKKLVDEVIIPGKDVFRISVNRPLKPVYEKPGSPVEIFVTDGDYETVTTLELKKFGSFSSDEIKPIERKD
jgi:hypothetical protein